MNKFPLRVLGILFAFVFLLSLNTLGEREERGIELIERKILLKILPSFLNVSFALHAWKNSS